MTQPAGRAAYCQSKARYCWNIFRKISPYNLMGRGVERRFPPILFALCAVVWGARPGGLHAYPTLPAMFDLHVHFPHFDSHDSFP